MVDNNSPTTKIYVGNLSENAESQELREMFEKYGEVKECHKKKSYAFVHMSNEDEAKVAIEALNNVDFAGTKISVKITKRPSRCQCGRLVQITKRPSRCRCGRLGNGSKECPRKTASRNKGPDRSKKCPKNPASRNKGPDRSKECPRNPASRNMGPGRGPPTNLRPTSNQPPTYPTPGYGDRFGPRFGMGRPYGGDRFEPRPYPDRMRPYPDPYERRPPPMGPPSQDNYRRPYEGPIWQRSPPHNVPPQAPSRYDFTQDPYAY